MIPKDKVVGRRINRVIYTPPIAEWSDFFSCELLFSNIYLDIGIADVLYLGKYIDGDSLRLATLESLSAWIDYGVDPGYLGLAAASSLGRVILDVLVEPYGQIILVLDGPLYLWHSNEESGTTLWCYPEVPGVDLSKCTSYWALEGGTNVE